MSLKIKYDNNSDEVVSLDNSEISSVLKTQSESVFVEETKMKQNNSGFIKKSLIDIALEYKNKETEFDKVEQVIEDPTISNEVDDQDQESSVSDEVNDQDQEQESSLSNKIVDQENTLSGTKKENIDVTSDISPKNDINDEQNLSFDKEINEANDDINSSEMDQKNYQELNSQVEPVTQQAINSVRDAVSQSINNSVEENLNNVSSSQSKKNIDSISLQVKENLESVKNIFSDLSKVTENILCETIENKIIELAQELAGYQIDKMPEKYEKKIKIFLKNINRFEEKMSIETNDKDYDALSKIDGFNDINNDIKFTPNPQLSRGDIILNCGGMHYSEKTISNIQIVNQGEK